jgi:hypothetical protein
LQTSNPILVHPNLHPLQNLSPVTTQDPLCLVETTPGLGVSSGYFAVDGPENAFDGDSVTGWVTNCDVSCNETRCAGADRGHRGGKYGRGIKCIKHQQNWGYPVWFF